MTLEQSDSPYRPVFHFSPERNWMNDPNGLVAYKGLYHLFFQHNPEGNDWGNMSWGHATSSDLLNWEGHPVAITHDENEMIFSGSIVIDHLNTTGFGKFANPPMVAIYTSVFSDGKQAQSLAFSADEGMTWTKYPGNPVLDRDSKAFRDPKVFWYESEEGVGYWVMVAVEAVEHKVLIFKSADLKRWDYQSSFGPLGEPQGQWECPDLVCLKVNDEPATKRWVLILSIDLGRDSEGSSTQYLVGDFDGIRFVPDATSHWEKLDYGRDFYAAVSFSNFPGDRCVLLGWMNNWNYAKVVPTTPWRGSMTLPRELSLTGISGKIHLRQSIPKEFSSALGRANALPMESIDLEGTRTVEIGRQYLLDLEIAPISSRLFGVNLLFGGGFWTHLSYDIDSQMLAFDRSNSGYVDFEESFPAKVFVPLELKDGTLHLSIYVDSNSIEVFAQDGFTTLTSVVYPSQECNKVEFFSLLGASRFTIREAFQVAV